MNKPTAAIFPLVKELDPVAAMADNERDEADLVKSRRLIALLALLLVVTGVWRGKPRPNACDHQQ